MRRVILLVLAAALVFVSTRRRSPSRREDADAEHLLFLRADQADDAGNLLCNITTSSYARTEQEGCQTRTGSTGTGSSSPRGRHSRMHRVGSCTTSAATRRPSSCSPTATPGIPRLHVHLAGSGLTCTNGHGHGLFLSRESVPRSGSGYVSEREQVVDRLAPADQPRLAVRDEHRRRPRHCVVRR